MGRFKKSNYLTNLEVLAPQKPNSGKTMEDKTEPPSGKELKSEIDFCNEYYSNLLGYKPEQTELRVLEGQWNSFCERVGLEENSLGIYLPRNQTAFIQGENPLSLFHEYFGHGLFCEQSLIGRKLVSLERELLDEEKEEFGGKEFSLEELKEFRKQSQTFFSLDKFRKENLAQYELFAVWTEYLLSNNGLRKEFEKRYESFGKGDREVIDNVINFSEQYGDLATFYAFGLKKIQDKKRLLKLSEDIFGKNLDRAPLVLHFGSGKPFSDIDLFVASNDIKPMFDYWIDVRAYSLKEIEKGISVLNPMITDPIIVGSLINGDEEYFKDMKKRIIAQPITEEAINFSLHEYESEKRRARDKSLGLHLQDKNLRSAKTFLTNALALKNDYKILTFNGLVNYSHVLSQSEKFIELKGGIE